MGPVPLTTDFANVIFNQKSFTVQPGQTHEVVVTFIPPKHVDASTFPLYSGFVKVTSGSESLQVTYIGLAASLKDKQVVDNTDFFFGVDLPLVLDSAGNIQDGATNYTFVGDDFPTLLLRYVWMRGDEDSKC